MFLGEAVRNRLMGPLLCGVLLLLGGCYSEEAPRRIVILLDGPHPFWQACESGAKAAEEELGLAEQGLVVEFQYADSSDVNQVELLQQYAQSPDVVAVGVSAITSTSIDLASAMSALQQQGVEVITIHNDINCENDSGCRFDHIGTDNVNAGRELGRAAAVVAPAEGARFAFLTDDRYDPVVQDRVFGFLEGMSAGSVEVNHLEDAGDSRELRKNIERILQEHPDCEMLVVIRSGQMPLIVLDVADPMVRESIHELHFDTISQMTDLMERGLIEVMLVEAPREMGYEAIRLIQALLTEDEETVLRMYPEYAQADRKNEYGTSLRIVVPEQGTLTKKAEFELGTECLPVSEFQHW